jgi:hypothetical protein
MAPLLRRVIQLRGHGTVKGTEVTHVLAKSAGGTESVAQKRVPLLIDPEFEEVEKK